MRLSARLNRALTTTSVFILVLGGCAYAQKDQGPFGISWPGGARTISWENVLDLVENGPPDKAAAALRDFRAAFGHSLDEQHQSAYVLGRLLERNPALSTSPANAPQANDKSSAALPPRTACGSNMEEALQLFEESAALQPLRELSLAHAIECATAASNEPVLRQLLQQQIAAGKDRKKVQGYEYALAQSYERTQEFDAAIKLFTKIQTEVPDSNYALGSAYYVADLALTGHNEAMPVSDAIQSFRSYIKHSPDGRFASEIVSRLQDMAAKSTEARALNLTAEDHEIFGQVYFLAGDYKNALSQWQLASSKATGRQRAICLASLGDTARARQTLLDAIEVNPTTSYASAAEIITKPLSRQKTKEFWQEILAAKPQRADAALWNIAIRSDPPQSTECFKRILGSYPTSEFAPESLWWLFWNQAKQAPHDARAQASAATIAREGINKYPDTRAAERLSYWLGKMHELEKKPQLATADYLSLSKHAPSSYYGHRSIARLKAIAPQPVPHSDAALAATHAPHPQKDSGWTTYPNRIDAKRTWSWPDPEQVLSPTEIAKRYGPTIDELFKLRQFDECIDALPSDAAVEFKSALLAKNDKPLSAINAAKVGLSGPPHHSLHWQLCYPLAYAAQVEAEANAKNVDPFLVHALIREESHYYHLAVSRSRAIGLMQLLPGTAYGVAKRLGVSVSGSEDFFKPEINIKLGTDYLSYVLARYSGNALFAVASYNGGPNAVKTWLHAHEQSGIGDLDYFVENIPVRETRDYVRKVFGAYWNYLAIYGAYPTHISSSGRPRELD